MSMKQFDFRWRYQPRKEIDIKLMRYIQSNQVTTKTEIMLIAVRSFWLFHAIIADSKDKTDVQRIARSCIQALRKQAQEIGELAGLSESQSAFPTQYSLNSAPRPISNKSLVNVHERLDNYIYDDSGLSNFL